MWLKNCERPGKERRLRISLLSLSFPFPHPPSSLHTLLPPSIPSSLPPYPPLSLHSLLSLPPFPPPSILSSLPPYSPLSLHTLHPSYVPSLSSRGIQHPLIPESWWKLRDRRRQWQLNLVTSWTTSETVCMLYVCVTHTLLAHNHLILKFGYIGTTIGAPFVTTLGLKVNLCHQSKFVSCQCLRSAASTVIIGFQAMTCLLVMAIAP